jgi:hypothetical protein
MQKPPNPLAAAGGAGDSCGGGGGRGSSLGADRRGEGGSHGRGGGGGKAAAQTLGDKGQRKRQRGEEEPQHEGTLKNAKVKGQGQGSRAEELPRPSRLQQQTSPANAAPQGVAEGSGTGDAELAAPSPTQPSPTLSSLPLAAGGDEGGGGGRASADDGQGKFPAPIHAVEKEDEIGAEDVDAAAEPHSASTKRPQRVRAQGSKAAAATLRDKDVEEIKKRFIKRVSDNGYKCHIPGCDKDFSLLPDKRKHANVINHMKSHHPDELKPKGGVCVCVHIYVSIFNSSYDP